MRFASVPILYWFIVLPLVYVILHALYKRRESIMDRFIQFKLWDKNSRESAYVQARIRRIFVLFFLAFMVLGLARPQWGYHLQDVKRRGLDILIAVDVSKSMLTQDVSPSRLERSKLAIKDMVKKLKGDRVGLIAFAGEAFLVCPLTLDYNGFYLSLNDLSVGTVPRGGTDLSHAIEEALKGYKEKEFADKNLVLITDGEDNEGDALAMARRAKAKGVKIYTVGIGTKEGDLIKIVNPDGGGFLKDAQGNYVKSRLNENLLQQIAYLTQGAYVRSSGSEFGLDYLYEQQLSKLEKHDIQQSQDKQYEDRFQWFLGVALILLLLETFLFLRRNA